MRHPFAPRCWWTACAALWTSCLPHLNAVGPVPRIGTERQGGAGVVVPLATRRPGFTADVVLPSNSRNLLRAFTHTPDGRAQLHAVGRVSVLPDLWFAEPQLMPSIDVRVGGRRTWEGRWWRCAAELGGMPTFIPPIAGPALVVGMTGYAAGHAALLLGPIEPFVSAEAAGGTVVLLIPVPALPLQSAGVLQAQGGLAVTLGPVNVAVFVGQWLRSESIWGPGFDGSLIRSERGPFGGARVALSL